MRKAVENQLSLRPLYFLVPKGWAVLWFFGFLGAQFAIAQTVLPSDHPGGRDFVEYWAAGRLLAYGNNPYSPEAPFELQSMARWSRAEPVITGGRDFMEYWAAGRLLAYGNNPYSPETLFELQRMAGWRHAQPLIMWNPPWALLIMLPFGLFTYPVGEFCWLLIHVCLILVSVQQLWRIYGNMASSRLPWLLALTYVPTIFVLVVGQISPFILVGLTAFLYFERKQKWFAMGAAAWILSLKPHLVYLFWIVFVLWVWKNRQWRVFSGTVLISLSAALIPLLFNPQIYFEYLALYKITDIPKPLDWLTATLRTAVRIFIGTDHLWLEFAPSIVAVAWVLYYWHRHKHRWDWREQLPLVVVVSVVSSLFAWTHDQVVFLPAIIEAAIWIGQKPNPWHAFWTARVYVAINVCHAVLRIWVADERWYFWLAPAFLANYLISRWEAKNSAGG